MPRRKLHQDGPLYPPGDVAGYTAYHGWDLKPNVNVEGSGVIRTFKVDVCAAECNAVAKCQGFVMNNEGTPTMCFLKDSAEFLYPVAAEKLNTTHSYVQEAFKPIKLAPPPPSEDSPVPSPNSTLSPQTSPSPFTPPPPPTGTNGLSAAVIAGIAVPVIIVLALVVGVLCFFLLKRRKRETPGGESFDGLKVFSYAALRTATSDFKDVLGAGGSADVFRGELEGRLLAVKKLKEAEHRKTSDQEFTAEARGLGRLLHVNLVQLLGYSSEPNRPKLLVYEFLDGGSLESLLYGKKDCTPPPPLSFDRRMEIALEIARGIEYCHHSIEPAVIHRDIKPSNILMTSADESGVPKVADFGLARMLDPSDKGAGTPIPDTASMESWGEAGGYQSGRSSTVTSTNTQSSTKDFTPEILLHGDTTMMQPGAQCTNVAGTFGYIDPEYLRTRRATLKSDVYSFGIVLLELIMGERPFMVYAHLQERIRDQPVAQDLEALDVNTYDYVLGMLLTQGESAIPVYVAEMLGQDKKINAHRCFEGLKIARQCLQDKGKMRPPMRQVVRLLEQCNEG